MDSARAVRLLPLSAIDDPELELRLEREREALHDLAQSIAALGLLQPIGVVATDTPERWRLVWGGRRLAAHALLGRLFIEALILDPGTNELDAAITENIHRSDLTPIEEARAIHHALERGTPPDTLALRWRKSREWLAHRLDLLDWPPDLQDAIHARSVTLAVAVYLAKIDHPTYRATLIEQARAHGCTALLARTWWADYEANKPRIIANAQAIQDLIERLPTYTVFVDCDACGAEADLTKTHTYRVCRLCNQTIGQLASVAPAQAPPDGSPPDRHAARS
jgi:ParB/RepB/Spo0J family partition protein